jgi:hypothetical protein
LPSTDKKDQQRQKPIIVVSFCHTGMKKLAQVGEKQFQEVADSVFACWLNRKASITGYTHHVCFASGLFTARAGVCFRWEQSRHHDQYRV